MPDTEATLRWTPASGPVAGYQVFVARNGGAMEGDALVAGNEVTLTGQPGERIEVAVRAWGYPYGPAAGFDWGPISEVSATIRFDGPPVVTSAYPLLDCESCRRFELRDLAGDVLLAVPHPTPGSWALVGIGQLVRGSLQALLRERATGALWVGDLTGAGMLPLTSHVLSHFAASTVTPPVDLDGDGVAEIVLHHGASGRIEIWGVAAGALIRRAVWFSPAGWALAGVGDLDGDRRLDVWLDTHHGMVWIDRVVGLARVGSTVFAVPMVEPAAQDVADYDGDGLAEVLWRDEAGALQISLLKGDRSAPQVEMRALASQPGDWSVVPRGSYDLDGVAGEEILLQNQLTGSVDVALPLDALAGRRQHLLEGDPLWRMAGMD